jgi:hypothetical protein
MDSKVYTGVLSDPISSAKDCGMRSARLLPHFEILPLAIISSSKPFKSNHQYNHFIIVYLSYKLYIQYIFFQDSCVSFFSAEASTRTACSY